MGSSTGKRVLKFALTDGKTEISALEYSHIPTISNDVTPGTKVVPYQANTNSSLLCFLKSHANI